MSEADKKLVQRHFEEIWNSKDLAVTRRTDGPGPPGGDAATGGRAASQPAAVLAFGEDDGGDGRDPRHPDALASGLAGVGLWTLTMVGLVVLVWLDQLLRQTDRSWWS